MFEGGLKEVTHKWAQEELIKVCSRMEVDRQLAELVFDHIYHKFDRTCCLLRWTGDRESLEIGIYRRKQCNFHMCEPMSSDRT